MKELAQQARPIDFEDWGSDRQIEAFNAFCLALEQTLSKKDFARLEAFSLKATTNEIIDYGLELARCAS